MPNNAPADSLAGFLGGIRVLEIGSELGEYCGKVLAGLGADVVRVEPPGGETTRMFGPFYHDEPHPDRSLYFWHYNLGKRSVVLDLDTAEGRDEFARLAQTADVVIDSRPRGYLAEREIGYDQLSVASPRLIWARITPFGDTGPWADYSASDLVHLALGGVMMNCGYDPDPAGFYETPPIAPQMWQSYQIAGEMTAMAILGALTYRLTAGRGQHLSTSVHEAVSMNTETDLPDWVYLAQPHRRVTCRHSTTTADLPSLSITKDGRYLLPYRTYLKSGPLDAWAGMVALLKDYRMQSDLEDPKYDTDYRHSPEASEHIRVLTDRLVSRLLYERDLWRDAQSYGLPWAPIRRPEENIDDEHWQLREAFFEVYHDELDEAFVYTGGKWLTEGMPWCRDRRPPLTGEHTAEVLNDWAKPAEDRPRVHVSERASRPPLISRHGKPFALSDVRVIDLSWMLASAGAGRFLSGMGAEVIKVEHESRLDWMRFSVLGACPPGGREERDSATGPIPPPPPESPNRGGSFMEINAGKLGLFLDLKDPRGRKILEDLVRDADMIVEGFSPGTMARMGLSYERLKELNPSIIYVQQSGLGEVGTYGRARTYGPTAAAISGISDMSGLPAPFPPAGIGYSYLDWFGAYNMAVAMLAALYRRNLTGQGCHIDASQAETGLYLTGTSVLDYTVNGRHWSRYGNRSPYKPAAPHGAYRTKGEDRWIAIAAFTAEQWMSLVQVLGMQAAAADGRFATLERRLENQDQLDTLVQEATQAWDGFELMSELQRRGVPAGVCQTAQDRYESDPQLAHLGWLVELQQTEIGRWPVKDHPTKLSDTPTYQGGRLDRSGPNYGEDNQYVLAEILMLSSAEIDELRQGGVLGTWSSSVEPANGPNRRGR
jgi:crotonobetainyl-CoA:carnitine CoA-transferase CaiB-like acyl-CoA transferase